MLGSFAHQYSHAFTHKYTILIKNVKIAKSFRHMCSIQSSSVPTAHVQIGDVNTAKLFDHMWSMHPSSPTSSNGDNNNNNGDERFHNLGLTVGWIFLCVQVIFSSVHINAKK